MPRSGREARDRLERAALDLVAERGFDQVTSAEIAERAGVTERTFFRHFADKREVLFDGEVRLTGWIVDALAAVPPEVPAWSALRRAIDALVEPLEAGRDAGDRLAAIIAATPSLQERAAAKEVRLVALVADLLVTRGSTAAEAALVARTEWGVLTHAVTTWRADPGSGLQGHIDRAFETLGSLVGGRGPRGRYRIAAER